jgi:hypothetical protein
MGSVGNNMPILFLLFFIAINILDPVSRNNNTVVRVLLLANKKVLVLPNNNILLVFLISRLEILEYLGI